MADASTGAVVGYAISVNGNAMPGTYPLHGLRIEQAINRIASATLTFLDGSPDEEGFPISASASFVPGNTVSIALGYDGNNSLVFEGIVVGQSLHVDNQRGPQLQVLCKDPAVKLTVGRKSANFSDQADSDVISQLVAAAGLQASVASTSLKLPTLVQYYATDWDFLVARAEANGLLVSALNGKVKVFAPQADSSPVLTLTYGNDILAFNAQLDALSQLAQVTATAWSFQDQQLVSASSSASQAGPGNLSSQTLAKVVGLDSFALQTSATESSDELQCWAKAQILRSELAKITGEVRFQGSAKLLPGNYLTLAGLGARFAGDHFVSAVVHEVSDGNWTTEASIGLAAETFTQRHSDIQAPAASGLLPGTQGLFNGTVGKICDDPDGEYRIFVEVALFDQAASGLWARMANFYSTSGQGTFFLPEVGDEVILGFLNQDPRYPVILGSLYSQKRKPFGQFTPDQQNSLKGIVSKSELRLLFDDQNKILTVQTPGGNSVVLDDQHQQVQVKDQNGNSLLMSGSGMTLKSGGDITLQADGKLNLKGTTGIAMQSSGGDIQQQALNIKHNADMQLTAKGGMSAQLQAGMDLTLKATMVMIN